MEFAMVSIIHRSLFSCTSIGKGYILVEFEKNLACTTVFRVENFFSSLPIDEKSSTRMISFSTAAGVRFIML